MSRKVGKNPTRHKFFCPNIVTIFIFKQSIINKQICTSPWSIILHDVIISPQKKEHFPAQNPIHAIRPQTIALVHELLLHAILHRSKGHYQPPADKLQVNSADQQEFIIVFYP